MKKVQQLYALFNPFLCSLFLLISLMTSFTLEAGVGFETNHDNYKKINAFEKSKISNFNESTLSEFPNLIFFNPILLNSINFKNSVIEQPLNACGDCTITASWWNPNTRKRDSKPITIVLNKADCLAVRYRHLVNVYGHLPAGLKKVKLKKVFKP